MLMELMSVFPKMIRLYATSQLTEIPKQIKTTTITKLQDDFLYLCDIYPIVFYTIRGFSTDFLAITIPLVVAVQIYSDNFCIGSRSDAKLRSPKWQLLLSSRSCLRLPNCAYIYTRHQGILFFSVNFIWYLKLNFVPKICVKCMCINSGRGQSCRTIISTIR
jgi:hypothetical protein